MLYTTAFTTIFLETRATATATRSKNPIPTLRWNLSIRLTFKAITLVIIKMKILDGKTRRLMLVPKGSRMKSRTTKRMMKSKKRMMKTFYRALRLHLRITTLSPYLGRVKIMWSNLVALLVHHYRVRLKVP